MKRPVERVFEETLRDLKREEFEHKQEVVFSPSVPLPLTSSMSGLQQPMPEFYPALSLFSVLPQLITFIGANLKEAWYHILFGPPDQLKRSPPNL